MTDKVQKIKNWISKEQDGLMDAQGNFEYPEREGIYHILCDLDAYIDSLQEEPKTDWLQELQEKLDSMSKEDFKKVFDKYAIDFNEEPVSDDLEAEIEKYCIKHGYLDSANDCGFTFNEQVGDIARHFAKWQKEKDESTTEDLGEYINELSKQFQEVSFAKLSRIAVMVAKWQRNQDTTNKLPEVINRTGLDEYAYQCAYDMSNDWAIENPTWHDVEDACKLGAKWQREQMLKDAVSRVVHIGDDSCPFLRRYELAYDIKTQVPDINEGDKVKVIIVKEG